MTPPANTDRYTNHRFPGEIISHGVWLYYRFTLSYRDVQEILLGRGIKVSHESIRKWCGKFGQDDANQLRRRQPRKYRKFKGYFSAGTSGTPPPKSPSGRPGRSRGHARGNRTSTLPHRA